MTPEELAWLYSDEHRALWVEMEALVERAGEDFTNWTRLETHNWTGRQILKRPGNGKGRKWDVLFQVVYSRTDEAKRHGEFRFWPNDRRPLDDLHSTHGINYPLLTLEELRQWLFEELLTIEMPGMELPEDHARAVLTRGYEWYEHLTGKLRPDDSAHPERDRLMMLITRVRLEIAAEVVPLTAVEELATPEPVLIVKEKIPGVEIDVDKRRIRRAGCEAELTKPQWHLFHAVYRALPGGATKDARMNGYVWEPDPDSIRKVKGRLNDAIAPLNLRISTEWALKDTLLSTVPPRTSKTVRTVP